MKQLIENKTNIQAFDIFNQKYGGRAIFLFPEFKNIQICAVYHDKSGHMEEELGSCIRDAFAYFFKYSSERKYAVLLVNEEVCKRLNLTEEEMCAGIAHEIGHIQFVKQYGKNYPVEWQEIFSDSFACRLGLFTSLSSLLGKLIKSEYYSKEQTDLMNKRILLIQDNTQNIMGLAELEQEDEEP